MSNITGTIFDPLGVGIATTLTLWPISTPTVDNANHVIATSPVVLTTATNGTFTINGLKAGDYEVTVGRATRFNIAVPSDNLTYDITALITTSFSYTGTGAPSGSVAKTGDTMTGPLTITTLRITLSALTYNATMAINMQDNGFQTVTLGGAVTISTTNRATSGGPGRSVALKILCDGTDRALTFAAGIRFVGSKPTTIAAGKIGILSLTSLGPNETDTIAAWAAES